MIHYALTIFLSAFLLFQVQPMIAKTILSWFGGTASVWTTCMLFFQSGLLGGYFYSHSLIERLTPRRQAILHSSLLGLSLLLLPVIPGERWKPGGGENPTVQILVLLAACVGLPYMLLSTTGPLVQAWFARARRGETPYRLFALSNFGSMLGLLTYPVLVEPYMAVRNQALLWTVTYAVFAVLCGSLAWLSARFPALERTHSDAAEPASDPSASDPSASNPSASNPSASNPSAGLKLFWVALAACPSMLLLAVTNHLTQDVASMPFLWVLPLSLYLLSFILTFDARGWYRRNIFMALLAPALCGLTYMQWSEGQEIDIQYSIPLHGLAFFVCCMVCHGELSRRKPHPSRLTSFYLMIAVGGALGGVFVGVLAPWLFASFFEYPIALGLCAFLAVAALCEEDGQPLLESLKTPGAVALLIAAAALCVLLVKTGRDSLTGYKIAARNFYGTLRVRETGDAGDWDQYRTLMHGSINHGEQWTHPQRRKEVATYYCEDTGLGRAMQLRRPGIPHRVAVLGLGTGTLAAYARTGDYYRFYEINPLILKLARTEFTYYPDCSGDKSVTMGDGRLSLEREPAQGFDLLIMDAFSGDSIPVHLVTREAFRVYLRQLRQDGILAVHISNKYLDLEPVIARIAGELGLATLVVETEESVDASCFGTTWVLVSANPEIFEKPEFQNAGQPAAPRRGVHTWTDDYSNLFRILK